MNSNVDLHDIARHDLRAHAEYIRQQNPRISLKFLAAADGTMSFLAEMPLLGGQCEMRHAAFKELRCFPVSGFKNYVIYYFPTNDGIRVIRVLHGARRIGPLLLKTLQSTIDP